MPIGTALAAFVARIRIKRLRLATSGLLKNFPLACCSHNAPGLRADPPRQRPCDLSRSLFILPRASAVTPFRDSEGRHERVSHANPVTAMCLRLYGSVCVNTQQIHPKFIAVCHNCTASGHTKGRCSGMFALLNIKCRARERKAALLKKEVSCG